MGCKFETVSWLLLGTKGIERDIFKLFYRACAHGLCNTFCNLFDALTVNYNIEGIDDAN